MNTNIFSTPRLLMFAKSELLSQKRMWLLWWCTIALVMLVLYGWDAYFTGDNSRFLNYDPSGVGLDNPITQVRGLLSFVSFFVTIVLISRSFSNYLQPRSACRLLMLPVSKAEQFTFITVFYFLVVPVVLFLTQFVIDFGFATYYGQPNLLQSTLFPANYKTLELHYDDWLYQMGTLMLSMLIMFSIYLYGGILFRRHNFAMTSLSLLALLMALFFVSIPIIELLTNNADWTQNLDMGWIDTPSTKKFIVLSVPSTISALAIFLAYLRFRNFQITK